MTNPDRLLKLLLAAIIAAGSVTAAVAAWLGLRREPGVWLERRER